MIDFKSKPFLIWAHRGRNRVAPENTRAAFRAAFDAKDAGIELDITLSSDGVPVVIHDDTLDRTSNGSGPVAAERLSRLKTLDAGGWFSPDFSGEEIPTLDEVLREFRDVTYSPLINIEIKESAWRENPTDSIEEKTVGMISDLSLESRVLISSFEWRSLRRVRNLAPSLDLGILVDVGGSPEDAVAEAREVGAVSIHPCLKDLAGGVPEPYSLFDGRIFPYTAGTEEIEALVRSSGLDGVFADLPYGEKS